MHCRIAANVGVVQYSNDIVTLSATAFLSNYAAPELFVMQFEDEERLNDHEVRGGSKTVQTDVYAFGSLYYAVRSKCSSTYSVALSNYLRRYSLIPFLLWRKPSIKSCDSSRPEFVQVD